MGSEQARDLRQQARMLEERLIGLSARDAREVEFAIGRVQDKVRTVSDDALWDRHVFAPNEEDRYAGRDSFEMRRPSDFEHMDRHVAPPVDRWEDAFDRGDEL